MRRTTIDGVITMIHARLATLLAALALGVAPAFAQKQPLPEPDVVLWGTVMIKDVPVQPGDDVTVIATNTANGNVVGTYSFLADAKGKTKGHYVLRIPMEFLTFGAAQSDDAVVRDDTIQLSVQQMDQDPVVAAGFTVVERGIVAKINIALGTPACPGDVTGDGMVDGADLGLLLGAWDETGGPLDLNDDGIVNGADLGILLGAWGPCR